MTNHVTQQLSIFGAEAPTVIERPGREALEYSGIGGTGRSGVATALVYLFNVFRKGV